MNAIDLNALPYSISKKIVCGIQSHASDWHLRQPQSRMRVNGAVLPFPLYANDQPKEEDLISLLTLTHESQREVKNFQGDRSTALDWGFNLTSNDGDERMTKMRFRGTACWTRNGLKIVLRHIPSKIPTMDEIGVPEGFQSDIKSIPTQGLILVCGATGSGKTTLIASAVSYLIQHAHFSVLTLEDPVEYLHEDDQGIVDQLERGHDFADFQAAFKSAMRQNPNVLLYGELRDEETISSAITASESGHLVFATIHAIDAERAITRIIDGTSDRHKNQIRAQLAGCLRSVISVKLLPTVEHIAKKDVRRGRIAAHEVCIANAAVATHIRDWRPHQIASEIKEGRGGMLTMDTSIAWLVRDGYVTATTGKSFANNPHEFEPLCKALRPNSRPKKRPFGV